MTITVMEFDTNGIKQKEQLDTNKKVDYVELALQDMTLVDYMEYKKHKEERNRRVYKKMGYDYDER